MRRRLPLLAPVLLAWATEASAQKLRDQLGGLLVFGDWTVPLRVGTLDAQRQSILPNDRYLLSAVTSNATLVSFLVNWMTANAANAPLASTGGGRAFRFAGGVPVEARPAPGPIYGEHATTLGRGAVLAGVNHTAVRYTQVRGVPLDSLRLTFVQGAAPANADALDLRAALDYEMSLTALYATVGVLDRVDLGVVVPLVQTRLRGASTARVVAAGPGSSTVIGGTADAPLMSSEQRIGGRATGIGDLAVRAKVNVLDRPSAGFGVLGDVRLPTGDADDLLGSGAYSARLLGVYTGRFGGLALHASGGYQHFASETINDAVLATAGVDADMAPWVTASLSVIGQFQAGTSAYQLPNAAGAGPPANIPTIRDDALSASLGAKFGVRGVRAMVNVLAPVTRGGPRPDLAYTFGLERTF